MAHTLAWSLAGGIATTYAVWTLSTRNGDGPLLGLALGALVFAGGIMMALGY